MRLVSRGVAPRFSVTFRLSEFYAGIVVAWTEWLSKEGILCTITCLIKFFSIPTLWFFDFLVILWRASTVYNSLGRV